MASITDLLTPEAMRKLETLVVRSRFVSEGGQAGAHKSPLKGQSVEFVDRRAYVKGDNLRHLDWKAFGRTEQVPCFPSGVHCPLMICRPERSEGRHRRLPLA